MHYLQSNIVLPICNFLKSVLQCPYLSDSQESSTMHPEDFQLLLNRHVFKQTYPSCTAYPPRTESTKLPVRHTRKCTL